MRRREFYPAITPRRTGHLQVSELHSIYWEESGNPEGKPVVFIHGGPGGGTSPLQRRFFDPARYRIVLFDQRGCGRSRPHAELRDNTTWHLVDDMEALRAHLDIERWLLFGGSWGSTLALAYAERHPDRVSEMVLRGIFLARPAEVRWFYQHGASEIFPEAWAAYSEHVPPHERGDLVRAYYRRLTSDDPAERLAAARAWSVWEASTSYLSPRAEEIHHAGSDDDFALAFARIEAHFFAHDAFFEHPEQLLAELPALRDIPAVLVQGRYDVVCPVSTAWTVARAWPQASLRVVADAGHSAYEPGIVDELIRATDEFAGRGAS